MNERQFARPRRDSRWRAGWIAGAAALAIAGCASGVGRLAADSPADVKEKVVLERANARWQALIKRDYAAAYEFFSPASREIISLESYQTRFKTAEYQAATIERVECMAEACKVAVRLTYDFTQMKMKGIVTPLEENWIIHQGQAWYVFRG